jgi:uncharacterized damage-inducible protein DinB
MADPDHGALYLTDILVTFRYYKTLAERAIAQVGDEQLHATPDAESNSIGTIVKHLSGNLRSRFTDFLTTDGEKPDRDRDSEFEMPRKMSRDELLDGWEKGWAIALAAIEQLTPADLSRTVYIRGEGSTVLHTLNRLVNHAAYHVGQIVFLAKHLASGHWSTLSIPKRRR